MALQKPAEGGHGLWAPTDPFLLRRPAHCLSSFQMQQPSLQSQQSRAPPLFYLVMVTTRGLASQPPSILSHWKWGAHSPDRPTVACGPLCQLVPSSGLQSQQDKELFIKLLSKPFTHVPKTVNSSRCSYVDFYCLD